MSTTPSVPVTVLGLGAMGRALAGAFLAAGHPTTVWNRSPGRADDLVAAGATEASTVVAAIAASPLTVVCVLDCPAVEAVFDAAGDSLAMTTVVNLTSSTPDDARALAARARAAGGRYLDGKIMVPTPLIGTDDCRLIYAGDRTVYDDHAVTLRALGGDADLLGDDDGLASLHDLAMLDVFFNGMAAFLHAAALVGAEGVLARTFLPHAAHVLSVLQTSMEGLARDVDQGQYPGDEDNLVMDGRALDHIVEASTARGVDPTLPEVVRTLTRTAIEEGHGADGFSRVVDLLRRPSPVPRANGGAPDLISAEGRFGRGSRRRSG
jgi:3-hydroxyisobutyrate dehydrogenase-like beta-hydroxyacid dehydrogenase